MYSGQARWNDWNKIIYLYPGDEAERVNATVFRAATDPTRDTVKKMAQ